MLKICEDFSQIYNVSFNAKKTQCILFRHPSGFTTCKSLVLNGNVLPWVDKACHLGNILNCNLSDSDDIKSKIGHFIGSVNKLLANFRFVQSHILFKLFQRYCTSFYGCTLWNLDSNSINDLYVAWNKSVRKIWGLPYTAHTRLLGPISGQPHISGQIASRFARFYERLCKCKNIFVNFMMRNCLFNKRSYFKCNVKFIYFNHGTQVQIDGASQCAKNILLKNENYMNDDVNILIDLINVRDGIHILDGFDHQEILDLISFISTG